VAGEALASSPRPAEKSPRSEVHPAMNTAVEHAMDPRTKTRAKRLINQPV
jgi:hypothetical protein